MNTTTAATIARQTAEQLADDMRSCWGAHGSYLVVDADGTVDATIITQSGLQSLPDHRMAVQIVPLTDADDRAYWVDTTTDELAAFFARNAR